jgi:plastocyanin
MGLRGIVCTAVAVLVPGGVIAGCGGSGSSSSQSQTQKKPPAKLEIKATGSGDELKFTVPPKAQAGPAEITFTNNAKDETDAQLISVQGKREDAEVVAQFTSAVQGKAVASWFKAAGGLGATKPGENATATQELKPGTYYVVSGEAPPKGPLAKIEVAMAQGGSSGGGGSGGGSQLPTVPAKVVATDYAFRGQNLKVGQPVEFTNQGKEWHHFIGAPIKGDATIEEIKKALEEERGEPPIDEENEIETAVMDGGEKQIVQADLRPGRYAFFCFIADRGGGPPHTTKGMVSEITVTE